MMRRPVLAIAVMATFAIGTFTARAAVACTGTAVTSCTQTCSSNCYVLNNLSCTNGQGITLSSGADLDMCGHSITCSGICNTPAVTMTASNSQVYNSVQASAESRITGSYLNAVDCGNHSGSKVLQVHFDNDYGYSAVDCAKIENNVFEGIEAAKIFLSAGGVANSDEIDNNYFAADGRAISVSGQSTKITIDHNLIAIDPDLGFPMVEVVSSSNLDMNNNVFLGATGDPISLTSVSSTAFSANYCDPTNTSCATCISNGQCAAPRAAFSMP